MQIMSDVMLNREIEKIVDDNSGGVKFMEILSSLLDFENKKDCEMSNPDRYLELIRNNPNLKVLEYSMNMSEDLKRVKYFVYRPL